MFEVTKVEQLSYMSNWAHISYGTPRPSGEGGGSTCPNAGGPVQLEWLSSNLSAAGSGISVEFLLQGVHFRALLKMYINNIVSLWTRKVLQHADKIVSVPAAKGMVIDDYRYISSPYSGPTVASDRSYSCDARSP